MSSVQRPQIHVKHPRSVRIERLHVTHITRRSAYVESAALTYEVWFQNLSCSCGVARCGHVAIAIRERAALHGTAQVRIIHSRRQARWLLRHHQRGHYHVTLYAQGRWNWLEVGSLPPLPAVPAQEARP